MSRTRKAPKESASKRLRSIFYKLWEKDSEGMEFEDYYESKMEKLINHYKKLL